jgi:DNA-binding transcriptional regulator WhiA
VRSKAAERELVYYLRNKWPLDLSETYVYEVSTDNRSIYRVFYSEFDSLSRGKSQLELLPDTVKRNSPYLHSVYRMQKALL